MAKKVDNKVVLWNVLGEALVRHTGDEIMRMKIGSNPEVLVVTLDGTDFEVRLVQKKSNIEYEQEDIRVTYDLDENDELQVTEHAKKDTKKAKKEE